MKLGKYVSNLEQFPDQTEEPSTDNAVEVEPNHEDVDVEQETTSEEQVAVAVDENQEAEEQVENVHQGTARLENAAKILDEIQVEANNMVVAEGTLSPAAASVITQTMESIYESLNMEKPVVPTTEAFKSTWSKRDASRVCLESLETGRKSIASRIIDGLKAALKFAANFLITVFKNRALLEKHIQKLISRTEKLSNDDATSSEKEVSGRFTHGLQFGSESNIETAKRILDTADASIGFFSECNQIIQDVRDMRPTANHTDAVSKFYGNIINTVVKLDGKDVDVSGAFPNAKSIYNSGIVGELSFMTNISEGQPIVNRMPVMSLTETETILKQALNVIKRLRVAESASNRITDAVKGIIRRIEQQYNALRGVMGSTSHASKANTYELSFKLQKFLTGLVSRIPSTVFNSVKYIGDYANACLNTYH